MINYLLVTRLEIYFQMVHRQIDSICLLFLKAIHLLKKANLFLRQHPLSIHCYPSHLTANISTLLMFHGYLSHPINRVLTNPHARKHPAVQLFM